MIRTDILSATEGDSKFCLRKFRTLVNNYIVNNFNKKRWVLDPDGNQVKDAKGNPVFERCVLSVPGFCCYAGIDSEDDFWTLMQHKNREYATLGRRLITHIRTQCSDLIVNDKNNYYSLLIGKTYFPDENDGDGLKKIPQNVKKGENGLDLSSEFANMSAENRLEALKALKTILKN